MRTSKYSLLGLIALTGLAACSTGKQVVGDKFTISPTVINTCVGGEFDFIITNDPAPAKVTFVPVKDGGFVQMTGSHGVGKVVGSTDVKATSSDGKSFAFATVNVSNVPCTTPGPGLSMKIVRADDGKDPANPFKLNSNASFGFKVVVTGGPAGSSRKATWKIVDGNAVSLISPAVNEASVEAVVKGVGLGSVKLVATSDADPQIVRSVNIEVVQSGGEGDKPSIVVIPSSPELKVNEPTTLEAFVLNSTSGVTWENDAAHPGIVSLTPLAGNKVKVLGLSPGTAVIKAKLNTDNTVTGSSVITVVVGNGGSGIEIPKPCVDFSNNACGNIPAGHIFPDPCTDAGLYIVTQQKNAGSEDVLYAKCTVKLKLHYPKNTTKIELSLSKTQNVAGDQLYERSFIPAAGPGVATFDWDTTSAEQGEALYLVMRIWTTDGQPQIPSNLKVVLDNYGPSAASPLQPWNMINNNTTPPTYIVTKPTVLEVENPAGVKDYPDRNMDVLGAGPAGTSNVFYFLQPIDGTPKKKFDRATAQFVCSAPSSLGYQCTDRKSVV